MNGGPRVNDPIMMRNAPGSTIHFMSRSRRFDAPELFLERHAREQIGDAIVDRPRGIARDRRLSFDVARDSACRPHRCAMMRCHHGKRKARIPHPPGAAAACRRFD
jgi:hypothetical protein